MAGIVGIFASIGDHIPILNKEKFCQPQPEGLVLRAHYRGTCLMILCFCLLVTTTEWISGNDSVIDCLVSGNSPIPENVINMYCWVMGTFSVKKHYVTHTDQLGNLVSQTGVGPYNPHDPNDEIERKLYYQWVPFVLFLQGVMFYVPHLIFKAFEGKKLDSIIAGLNNWVMSNSERKGKEEELATYIRETKGTHNEWCLKILFAQFLYLVNVVGQIFFTDCFLGYEFSIYGVQAASLLEEAPETRVDPMSMIFPRISKCTFHKFGPSGTITRHDAQCVLPINIINEKIYVFMWFWFIALTLATVLHLIWTLGLTFSFRSRRVIIKRKLWLNPKKNNFNINVNLIVNFLDFGDWKLLYHLMRNMDALVFAEFCSELTAQLEADARKRDGETSEIMPLDTFKDHSDMGPGGDANANLNSSTEKLPLPDSPKSGGSLKDLGDGNYLASAPGAGHTDIY